ncbi:MAG: phage terminase large subunit family protein [Planctomycetaceae bacterium]|jgi:hypothetical protein|nr:phage terminase large subunit family protein [Planctomycetaceae bacterium]
MVERAAAAWSEWLIELHERDEQKRKRRHEQYGIGTETSGATLVSVGITGAIRGKNRMMPNGEIARPDMIVIDDPQTDSVARSPVQIRKLEDVINKTVSGLVGPSEELGMVMTCTVIQEGDLADRYLNQKLYPQWRGLRFKMVEKMPERMDLWDKYWETRKTKDYVAATMFYKRNRSEMQKGAVVSWEANYTVDKQLDALQFAMDKYYENYESFMAECQNEPVSGECETVIVPAKTIRTRLNGLERRQIPLDTQAITAFVDCHDDLLYWMVAAWSGDFIGYIIDYDVFPEQTRQNFSRSDKSLITLKKQFNERRSEGSIAAGLEMLLYQLLDENYTMPDGSENNEVNRIDKILIDSGYKPHVIESVIMKIGSPVNVRPSLGVGVGAKQAPMMQYQSRDRKVAVMVCDLPVAAPIAALILIIKRLVPCWSINYSMLSVFPDLLKNFLVTIFRKSR